MARWMILVLSLWTGLAGTAAAETYVVAVNDAPPYRMVEQTASETGVTGIYVDIMQEAARRLGIDLEFRVVPFARALAMMKAGTADIMLGPNWTVERSDFMVYLDAQFPAEPKVVYLRPGLGDVAGYSDLRDLTVGVLLKARYFDPFDYDRDVRKFAFRSYESALRSLDLGRVDAVIVPQRQGEYLLRSLGLEFERASFLVPGRPSFVTLSKRSTLLARRTEIETVMKALWDEGYLSAVFAVYPQ